MGEKIVTILSDRWMVPIFLYVERLATYGEPCGGLRRLFM